MAPGSLYLTKSFFIRRISPKLSDGILPKEIANHLFFTFYGNEAGDGTVSLSSELRLEHRRRRLVFTAMKITYGHFNSARDVKNSQQVIGQRALERLQKLDNIINGRSPMSALTHWLKKRIDRGSYCSIVFFVDVYRGRPLIYNTLGRQAFTSSCLCCFAWARLTFDTLFEYRVSLLPKKLILTRFQSTIPAIQFWLIILLLIFVTSKGAYRCNRTVRIRQLFVGH